MLLNTRKASALASIEVVKGKMTLSEVERYLEGVERSCKVAFGLRCTDAAVEAILECSGRERFVYEEGCGFYETATFYALNRFVEEGQGEMVFIANFDKDFRLIRVSLL